MKVGADLLSAPAGEGQDLKVLLDLINDTLNRLLFKMEKCLNCRIPAATGTK